MYNTAEELNDNIIQLDVINGKLQKKTTKYNKDGSIKRTHCNKKSGKDSEVFAFRTREEIAAMINVFNNHITNASTLEGKQIACRNKLLFLIGINVGIRASDLRTLKWNFFYDDNLEFKEFYTLQPKKQSKQKKFVKLFFNQTVKTAIENYVKEYPINNLNDYLFVSRKGDEPITVASQWRIIKDAAAEAGIKQNIGSHSLRKSWGFWCWHNASDKSKALVTLQRCFNHSSTLTTMKYIGLIDDEISDMYHSVELGLECL